MTETASGGVVIGGRAQVWLIQTSCPCNTYNVTCSGGVSFGGTAEPTIYTWGGGVTFGGSADLDVRTDPFDDLVYYWPLSESDFPYIDVAHSHNGTEGVAPEPSTGVFCGVSQLYSGEEFVSVPSDPLDTESPFTISLWAKVSSICSVRAWFGRGPVVFGHSYLNHLLVSLDLGGEDGPVDCYSSVMLERERWYHVACTWDLATLNLYLNGVLVGTEEAVGTPVAVNPKAIIGNRITGEIQDVRLWGVALGEDYLRAQYDNYCLPGWYFVGTIES